MRKLLIAFAIAALSVASAETFRVKFYQQSFIGQSELKPGDYKLELNGNKVVISGNKQTVEAQVKVETAKGKFPSTSVKFDNGDGKYRISEIRLGGTTTKLVLED